MAGNIEVKKEKETKYYFESRWKLCLQLFVIIDTMIKKKYKYLGSSKKKLIICT